MVTNQNKKHFDNNNVCYYSSESSANFVRHDVAGSFMVTTIFMTPML